MADNNKLVAIRSLQARWPGFAIERLKKEFNLGMCTNTLSLLSFRYWGKAKPAIDGPCCHLLPFHCLDVAAVGWQLLSPERPLSQWLAVKLDLPIESLRELLVFLLGLHDLGKFSRAFQGLADLPLKSMVPSLSGFAYTQRHDGLGALLWEECWIKWLRDETLAFPKEVLSRLTPEDRIQLKQSLTLLVIPMFGHHGQPVSSGQLKADYFFGEDEISNDIEAAREFTEEWARLIAVTWPVDKLLSPRWCKTLQSLSWTLAGWAVLSDWLGSNQEYFTYHDTPESLADYWTYAKETANQALADRGFLHTPSPVPYAGLDAWFDGKDVQPTPLQSAVEKINLAQGPQLFIIEDIAGAGKTEAACILTQRLLAAGHAEGLYFALPTMATSNAMYRRLGNLHHRFFSVQDRPSFVLAHGARELNEDFARALGRDQPADLNYGHQEGSASAQCNHWLADSRKKALLADVGVGTVDQVLMGVLPFRHQSLRLYGLARKILIIDEVHAYDIYTQGLLGKLLTYHARQGGSAILLTATLPMAMRRALVRAWRAGLALDDAPLHEAGFPLLTHIHADAPPLERAVAARPQSARSVAVNWLADEQQAVDRVLEAVVRGECVAWVRNTVDDAIRAFEMIRERHPDLERCVLFHSRFAMADRQRIETEVLERLGKDSTPDQRCGQVLISTQVFQESLDCDVELLISDLAPIDLLIQRAGRLQRHERGPRRPPELLVLAPEWSERPDKDWLKRLLPGTQAVYRDTALCWLTQRVLRQQDGIHLPEQARTLMESVYGACDEAIPEGLINARLEQTGAERGKASMAGFNALDLAGGYLRDRNEWQDEHREIGTRLTDEPTVNVALLKMGPQGDMVLGADELSHAAMLSQIKLRESQARKLPELPGERLGEWETLQARHKALKYTQPWLPEQDAAVRYDPVLGCLLG